MAIPSLLHPGAWLRSGRVMCSVLLAWGAAADAATVKFDFGAGEVQPGHIHITPQTTYDPARGFGLLQAPATPEGPLLFAVDVQEGNYRVTVRFGHPTRATSTALKAESRRLMVEDVATVPGQYDTRTFAVNVRKPAISTGGITTLKDGETGPPLVPNWDDHLTFEFVGRAPGVASLEIKPAPDAITLFIAGDSTVTDQPREPWAGWGQMIPRFFDESVAVSNHAWSGLALFSFEQQKRLEKILSMMKPGDYLLIQFGHNDQKDKSQGAGPFTSYAANLKRFIDAARSKGGRPVLVSPMERRRWAGDEPLTTLSDYAEAVRQVGAEQKVPVIDLHAMSLKLYKALGPEKSTRAFVFYPANTFPDQKEALKDNTHHNAYGAYELARCVVEGMRTGVPELATRLADDAAAFDPAHPDPPENVDIPASPTSRPH